MAGAAVIAAIAGSLVSAPSASAAWSDCPNGYYCLFAGPNGTGGVYYTAAQPAQLGWMANNAESYWNRTIYMYCEFDEVNHQVYRASVPAGGQANLPAGIANRIESLGKLGGGYC